MIYAGPNTNSRKVAEYGGNTLGYGSRSVLGTGWPKDLVKVQYYNPTIFHLENPLWKPCRVLFNPYGDEVWAFAVVCAEIASSVAVTSLENNSKLNCVSCDASLWASLTCHISLEFVVGMSQFGGLQWHCTLLTLSLGRDSCAGWSYARFFKVHGHNCFSTYITSSKRSNFPTAWVGFQNYIGGFWQQNLSNFLKLHYFKYFAVCSLGFMQYNFFFMCLCCYFVPH